MKLFVVGLDPLWTAAIREAGYNVVVCESWPEAEAVEGHAVWMSSQVLPSLEIGVFRERYPRAELLYAYLQRGIGGSRAVAAVCEQYGVKFIRPGIAITSLIELLDDWFRVPLEKKGHVLGVFGSLPGVGVSVLTATLAQMLAVSGKRIVMLGLNLYNPGLPQGTPQSITLDHWRQRLVARLLQPEDIQQLPTINGHGYLPGNTDLLATLDYTEEDVSHLLEIARDAADIVVADFGSIPESAAWYAGMQQSSLRLMVTHPSHGERMASLIRLAQDMGISAEHLFLIANRAGAEDMPLKTLASMFGMQPGFSLIYKGLQSGFSLQLSKKEQEAVEQAMHPLFAVMGVQPAVTKRKGWL